MHYEFITACFSIRLPELHISQPTPSDYMLKRFLAVSSLELCDVLQLVYSCLLFNADLRTHSLNHSPPLSGSRSCDIIQLAAISGGHTFNVYIMPEDDMDAWTEKSTGFKSRKGKLFQNKIAMPTITLHKALSTFISFLQSFDQPVVLAAHNAQRFDKPVLDRALFRCSLTEQFNMLGSSFLDTLLLSKALYPGLNSYEQGKLSYPFLGKPDNSHNALIDVTALQELYRCWNPNRESVLQCAI